MLYSKTSFFIIITIILLSCTHSSKNSQIMTFKRDLPPDSTGKNSLFASIIFIRDSLQLDTLENGFDSLQIRIWLKYTSDLKQKSIIIKNKKGTWSAYYYEFKPKYYFGTDSLLYFEKHISEKYPKISWHDFMDKLYRYKISTLPDFTKVKGYYYPATHNDVVAIEVSTVNEYRLYNYPSPALMTEFSEAKNVEKILNLITQEFDIFLKREI